MKKPAGVKSRFEKYIRDALQSGAIRHLTRKPVHGHGLSPYVEGDEFEVRVGRRDKPSIVVMAECIDSAEIKITTEHVLLRVARTWVMLEKETFAISGGHKDFADMRDFYQYDNANSDHPDDPLMADGLPFRGYVIWFRPKYEKIWGRSEEEHPHEAWA